MSNEIERGQGEEELFVSPEQEVKEKGPIYYYEREGKLFVSVAGIDLEVYQGKEGEVKPDDLEGKTPEERAEILREKTSGGTEYKAEDFEGFVLDKKSLEILGIFAKAAKLNQPVLMEGRHDIGKTYALEYLAYLINHYLIYQPCSGQTDVLEFMGKYVPATESGQKRFQQLLETRGELKPDTQAILAELKKEGRLTLTLGESKRIAELEGILSPEEIEKEQWTWTDGTIARAIHHDGGKGCWLYFDELGAVEPNVYIKINPLLSGVRGARRITVTENATAPVLKAGPEFRLFATTNPPEDYQAREPFARDYLSRWFYHRVERLDEDTFKGRVLADITRESPEIPQKAFMPVKKGELQLGEEASEADQQISKVLFGELYVRFHKSAQQFLESYPWETREQQFDFDDNRDRQRLILYFQNFQTEDPIQSLKEAIEYCYLGKINPDKIIEEPDGSQVNFREKLRGLFDDLVGSGAIGLKTREKIEQILESRDPEIARQRRDALIGEILEGIDNLPSDIREDIQSGAAKLRRNQ